MILGITISLLSVITPCQQARANLEWFTDSINTPVQCVNSALRQERGFPPTVGGWFDTNPYPVGVIYVVDQYDIALSEAIIYHEAGHRYDFYGAVGKGMYWGSERPESASIGLSVEQFAEMFAWLANGHSIHPQLDAPPFDPPQSQVNEWRASGFMPSFFNPQVRRLYLAAFLRAADQDGMDYWMYQKAHGWDFYRIANFFAVSPEFNARYGALSNYQFVTQVYWNVLGRAPDQGGLDWWTARLNEGATRGWMLVGFSEAKENQ